jgi:hypothetical protein
VLTYLRLTGVSRCLCGRAFNKCAGHRPGARPLPSQYRRVRQS